MAYIEEETPAVPPQIPLAPSLYTVPDFQAPPNTSGQPTLGFNSALEMETCIIEEEIPSEEHHEEALPAIQPPLVIAPEPEWTSTCRLSQEHLDLIFDMRRDMAEQLHRHTILSSRLDMLFDALSGEPDKRRCSTCAQLFVFAPTRLQHHGDKGNQVHPLFNLVVFFCHYAFSVRTIIFYSVILFKVSCLLRLQSNKTFGHLFWFPSVWQNKWSVLADIWTCVLS
jgi:hypothetical protein